MRRSITRVKQTGATFTPPALATYLSRQILEFTKIDSSIVRILDPACGDGELLLAVGRLLTQAGASFILYGYDINPNHVALCEQRLNERRYTNEVQTCDFLLECTPPKVDIIIANPPYVRTQVLGKAKAQQLAEKYKLKGRVDLYYPFLIEMTRCLVPGGTLGVITSNRYLYTKSGESVRSFLAYSLRIDRVVDLGDTKLFDDAAVLPAILVGRKIISVGKPVQQASYVKIYEEPESSSASQKVDDLYSVLSSKTTGLFEVVGKTFKQSCGQLITNQRDANWQLLTLEESKWVEQVRSVCPYTIKDLAKVRVGVKTTADNVFIRNDWHDLPKELRPEDELLRSIISQQDVERWQSCSDNSTRILYTHEDQRGKKRVIDFTAYPRALNYLETHREQLEGRSYVIKAKRKWYEIWVPQQPRLWKYPKLIIPDISERARFHLDKSKAIVNGNCYWISQKDLGSPDWLLLMQGMANSQVLATYHDLCFNNRLYAGRRRYLTQYVENYPLPDLATPAAQSIVATVRSLNQASQQMKDVAALEARLNDQVSELVKVELPA